MTLKMKKTHYGLETIDGRFIIIDRRNSTMFDFNYVVKDTVTNRRLKEHFWLLKDARATLELWIETVRAEETKLEDK